MSRAPDRICPINATTPALIALLSQVALTHSPRRPTHKSWWTARLTSNETDRVPRWPSRAQVGLITRDRARFWADKKIKWVPSIVRFLILKLTCCVVRLSCVVSGQKNSRANGLDWEDNTDQDLRSLNGSEGCRGVTRLRWVFRRVLTVWLLTLTSDSQNYE